MMMRAYRPGRYVRRAFAVLVALAATTGVAAQTNLVLPVNASVTSGTLTCVASNSITASGSPVNAPCVPAANVTASGGFVVSATASVTFEAGSTVTLLPGFHAGPGTSGTVFHALIGQVPQVATPVIAPGTGTYTSAQSISISSATPGASIRYTLDNTTPSETFGNLYSTPVLISSTSTVRAIAWKPGMLESTSASAALTINQPVATPQFSVPAGTYSTPQSVLITSATPAASIRYTTDNSQPTSSSGTLYTGAVTISATSTLKAIAFRSGLPDSPVASASYTISQPADAPVFSPPPGLYSTLQMISMSSTTSGSTIWWTKDGPPPVAGGSAQYTGSIAYCNFCAGLPPSTFRAITAALGWMNSSVTTGTYDVEYPGYTAEPSFSPAGGIFNSPHQVTISSATSGATIRYTLDGSTPSRNVGTLYQGPITVPSGSPVYVSAFAYSSGLNDANATSAVYISTNVAAPLPSITPNGGNFGQPQVITLLAPGASIRYTTDGSVPSDTSGTVYTQPFVLNGNYTVKAIAYQTGVLNSSVVSAAFSTNNISVLNTPVISPAPGTYGQTVAVNIAADPNATVHYTTDGTPPTQNSPTYTGSFPASSSVTVRAYASMTGRIDSPVNAAAYAITPGGGAAVASTEYIRLGSRTVAIETTGPPPAFSVVAPRNQSLAAGTTGSFSVSVTGQNGFASSVSLSLAGLPSGATYSFSPASVTPGAQTGIVSLGVVLAATTTVGAYPLTVTGSSQGTTISAPFTLAVTAAAPSPTYYLTIASSGSSAIPVGGTAQYTITVAGLNGFSSAVTFATSGLPAGVTATFSPATVSGSGTTIMTLATSVGTPGSPSPPLPFTVGATSVIAGTPVLRTVFSSLAVIHDPPIHGVWNIPADGSDGIFSVDWSGQLPGDVSLVQINLYQTTSQSPTCQVFYHPDTNAFVLQNDGGGACSVVPGGSSAQMSGPVLTTNFSLHFDKTRFAGELTVAFAASNAVGDDGGGDFGYFNVQ